MNKTITMVGAFEQKFLLELLMEAANLQLTPEQQAAALNIIAHQPVGMTMADFLTAAKTDSNGVQLLVPFITALEKYVAGSQQYGHLFDGANVV